MPSYYFELSCYGYIIARDEEEARENLKRDCGAYGPVDIETLEPEDTPDEEPDARKE